MDYACKISVIIPVYNGTSFLDYSVASWTAQTLQDIEIIYVNDASTDTSLEKLNEWGIKDSRIRIFSLPQNKGTFCARKMGIRQARGKYIMFADQDDTVLPETCEELAHAMDEAQVDILQFGTEVISTQKDSAAYTEKFLRPYTESILHGCSCLTACFRENLYTWSIWNKIYRSELCKKSFEAIEDQLLPISDDKVIYFVIAYEAKTYKGISKKYYQYFIGKGQTGQKIYTLSKFEDFCKMSWSAECIEKFLTDKSDTEQYADIIQKNRLQLLSYCVSIWLLLNDDNKAAGFDMMIRYWRPEEVVCTLAERCFYDTARLAKVLHASKTLTCGIISEGRTFHQRGDIKTIAACYHSTANGETERVLCQLCRIWQTMGCKVIVLTDKEPCEDDFELPSGTERITIPNYQTVTPQTYCKRAAELRRIINDHHIDAVVHNVWADPVLFWDILAIKAAGAACLVCCPSVFSAGTLWNTRYENTLAPAKITDALITLSETSHDFWKHCNDNVHVTINPVSDDLGQWHPAPFSASHKILWLGRLSPEKNPMDVLPVMQEVVKAVPDAVLTIVGKSEDDAAEKQLQAQITKLHLEENIRLEGFHKDVRPWYLASQIFLMTSSYEGYPMTLQESKMAGIPCVMYELPCLTLCEGSRGIIPVPQGDTKAAAQAIISLLLDDALCAQYGRDARAHMEELARFDLRGKWQQIFESVRHTHKPLVSKTEKLMMETLISCHGTTMRNAKKASDMEIKRLKQALDSRNKELDACKQELDSRCREIQQLRHGNYLKRVARAVVPNRIKPFLKAMVRRIPHRIKNPVKRLLRW